MLLPSPPWGLESQYSSGLPVRMVSTRFRKYADVFALVIQVRLATPRPCITEVALGQTFPVPSLSNPSESPTIGELSGAQTLRRHGQSLMTNPCTVVRGGMSHFRGKGVRDSNQCWLSGRWPEQQASSVAGSTVGYNLQRTEEPPILLRRGDWCFNPGTVVL